MSDERKHPRINIKDEFEKAPGLKGASLRIGREDLRILDMSLSGMAAEVYEGCAQGDIIEGQIELGEPVFEKLSAEVMWKDPKVMGLRFSGLNESVYLKIADFLQDRLIGQNMIEVGSRYFADHVDFHRWFHGPANTNVFVWMSRDPDRAERVVVSFGEKSVILQNESFFIEIKAPQVIEESAYAVETLPSRDSSENTKELENDSPLVLRAVEVLAQLVDEVKPVKLLLESVDFK